ncbi:MAG: NIPSNAP family protein [Burkholderiales bacterium]|nr:NIPSNAP family protein [Burkholderiales bacterium]
MIYEFRTYDLKPHAVAEFEKRFGEAYENRKAFSPLAAFWHAEIGPLNQVIHVWPYRDLAERNRVREEAQKAGGWPPKTAELILAQRSDIYIPYPMSPEMRPGRQGPYFEMRIYTLNQPGLVNIARAWEHFLPQRLKFGPLTAVLRSELGGINKFMHIWPYPSLDARADIRRRAQEAGVWPPSAQKAGTPPYELLHQENRILLPAAFSPLQ